MPRNPYYSGPIASATVVHAPTPQPGFLETALRGGGQGLKSVIAQAFYNPEADPDFQRARHYGAQADAERYKLERQQGADQALAGVGDQFDEYGERIIPGVTSSDAVMNVAAGAINDYLAEGGDPKQASAIARAFLLRLPGPMADELGVRANSLLEGKYLAETESPSLARQDSVREDEQLHEGTKWEGDWDTDLRKEGIASSDRRYAADTSASASRYGADRSAAASIYGHDRSYQASRENKGDDIAAARANPGEVRVETVTDEDPVEAYEPGPIMRAFGREPRPAQPGRKIKRTITQPLGAAAQAAAPSEPPPLAQRVIGKVYDSPNGPMTWTAGGWVPAR